MTSVVPRQQGEFGYQRSDHLILISGVNNSAESLPLANEGHVRRGA